VEHVVAPVLLFQLMPVTPLWQATFEQVPAL
jgi:hypothetical protein